MPSKLVDFQPFSFVCLILLQILIMLLFYRTYTVETNGFYYSRETNAGAKHILIGANTSSKASNATETLNKTKVDISYAAIQNQPGIWFRVDEIHSLNQHQTRNDSFKLKLKLYSYTINKKPKTLCKLESEFLTRDEMDIHIFQLLTMNGKSCKFRNNKDLMLRLKVQSKQENKKRIRSLGQTKILLDLKPDGEATIEHKILTNC